MTKHKKEISPQEVPYLSQMVIHASNTVVNKIKYEEYQCVDLYPWVLQNIAADNLTAIFQWAIDAKKATNLVAQKCHGDDAESFLDSVEFKVVRALLHNSTAAPERYLKVIRRMNVWKRSPYLFFNEENKLTAWFVGRKIIESANSYAWTYERIFSRSGAAQETCRKAYVYARHIFLAYYAITGINYAKRWSTYPMQNALAGDDVDDKILQNLCRIVRTNATTEQVPDCWQIMTNMQEK